LNHHRHENVRPRESNYFLTDRRTYRRMRKLLEPKLVAQLHVTFTATV